MKVAGRVFVSSSTLRVCSKHAGFLLQRSIFTIVFLTIEKSSKKKVYRPIVFLEVILRVLLEQVLLGIFDGVFNSTPVHSTIIFK